MVCELCSLKKRKKLWSVNLKLKWLIKIGLIIYLMFYKCCYDMCMELENMVSYFIVYYMCCLVICSMLFFDGLYVMLNSIIKINYSCLLYIIVKFMV